MESECACVKVVNDYYHLPVGNTRSTDYKTYQIRVGSSAFFTLRKFVACFKTV